MMFKEQWWWQGELKVFPPKTNDNQGVWTWSRAKALYQRNLVETEVAAVIGQQGELDL